MISIAQMVAAITGRRIAEHATAPELADPAEVADLKARLAASEGEIRRVLDQLAAQRRVQHDADEEIVRLRAANLRLVDRLEALEPAARYGPSAAVAG